MRIKPKGSDWWPEQTEAKPVDEIQRMYGAGYVGAYVDTQAQADCWDSMRAENDGLVCSSDLCHDLGIAGSAAGKLVVNYLAAAFLFPNCYPSAAQERGDCVSHGAAGAALMAVANEIFIQPKDEVTGEVEGVPELPRRGVTEGVISSAYQWWCRRSGGDGWSCPTAARTLIKDGVMLMKDYPGLGFDLTEYSYSTTAKYARSGPPRDALELSHEHQIRKMIEVDSIDSLRDLMHGTTCGVFDCGGQAWSSNRDENGVSVRRGSWAHSMKVGGVDDRDVVKQRYGEPLVLSINNWGRWNSGGRDIMDSADFVPEALRKRFEEIDLVNPSTGNLMIPEGSCWIRERQYMRRYIVAMTSAEGWKAKTDNILV